MSDHDNPVLIYGTFPDRDTALNIAGELVDGKLAACVNILGDIVAIYNWQGAGHQDHEVAALIKTRQSAVEGVIAKVLALHPYDNPALMVIPVAGGSQQFLGWIMAQTDRAET